MKYHITGGIFVFVFVSMFVLGFNFDLIALKARGPKIPKVGIK
jgi:hypothetical protein